MEQGVQEVEPNDEAAVAMAQETHEVEPTIR
jgi:hypothetical protein